MNIPSLLSINMGEIINVNVRTEKWESENRKNNKTMNLYRQEQKS